jgi:hypothetical protein
VDILDIAKDKFGTHVLCKAIMMKDLEVSQPCSRWTKLMTLKKPILDTLLEIGVFDSLKTGARKLWREVGICS